MCPVNDSTSGPYEWIGWDSALGRIQQIQVYIPETFPTSPTTTSSTVHLKPNTQNPNMASQDTITISSGEEDDDVQIIQVTKRDNRKRRKLSDSTHTQAGPENKDEKQRNTTIIVSGSSATSNIPARAKSADIPTSSFNPLPVPGRSSSAPQDRLHTHHLPLTSQHALPVTLFLNPHARPSTPIHQSSSHLSCPASSNPQKAYPTPETASQCLRHSQLKDLMSSSLMVPERGIPALALGEVSTSNEGNRQETPEVVRAIVLQDPFGQAKETPSLDSGVGKRMDEPAPEHRSKIIVKQLPRATIPSSVQSAEEGGDNPNTKDAADNASGENDPCVRSQKRKLHSLEVENTLPQPRIRNRILWSTPAFEEPNNNSSGSSPLNATTQLARNSEGIGQSASTISQEPGTHHTRKTWTCKMYADLAQQLQESFPFADFAKKYSRSEHEVFDLFSAVVHLPLLQKSSTGLARVSLQGHQSVKTYRTLVKETKKALAKKGKKEKKEPESATASLKLPAENDQVPKKAAAKTPSKGLLDAAVRAQGRVDAR